MRNMRFIRHMLNFNSLVLFGICFKLFEGNKIDDRKNIGIVKMLICVTRTVLLKNISTSQRISQR